MQKITKELANKNHSIIKLFSIFNKLSKLKPAMKKYIEVLKNAKKVD